MKRKKSVGKLLKSYNKIRYIGMLEGLLVGMASGFVVITFRLILEKLKHFAPYMAARCTENPALIFVWFLILIAGASVVHLLLKWEPLISGSGIPQVSGELRGQIEQSWWKVLLAKLLGGSVAIGMGLSMGREGPSVQLGAMCGKGYSRLASKSLTEEKLLITCGAAAGLSAAFNAPIAGALFALEELHKGFNREVLVSSMASSIAANFVCRNVFGLAPIFDFSKAVPIPFSHVWLVILMGIIAGIFGAIYNRTTAFAQNLYEKINSGYVKILISFFISGILAFILPQVLGGGSHLCVSVATGIPLKMLLILFLVKFLFSISCFASGAPGGIFLPLLVMGSLLGGIFHGIFRALGLNLNLEALVILGMAGAFSAIVRSPITGILLITEMTGNFTHLIFLSVVALIAYTVADLLNTQPIYDQLLRRLLDKSGKPIVKNDANVDVIIETPIQLGSYICNRTYKELKLPSTCVVVAIRSHEIDRVPTDNIILRHGDSIISACPRVNLPEVQQALDDMCVKFNHE